MVSKILVFVLIVGTASAAVWPGRLPEKPKELAHKEGCYIKEINDVVPFGTTVTPSGKCIRMECAPTFIDYAWCGVPATDNDTKCYKISADVSKPYPDCCQKIKCARGDYSVVKKTLFTQKKFFA